MNPVQLSWYLEAIKHEVEQINAMEFVGNINFQMNIKCGTITNMNTVLSKSVKMPEVRQNSGVSAIS